MVMRKFRWVVSFGSSFLCVAGACASIQGHWRYAASVGFSVAMGCLILIDDLHSQINDAVFALRRPEKSECPLDDQLAELDGVESLQGIIE